VITYAVSYRCSNGMIIKPGSANQKGLQLIGRIDDLTLYCYTIDLYEDDLEIAESDLARTICTILTGSP
jgi:hypothetical protein